MAAPVQNFEEICTKLAQRNEHTDDFAELRKHKHILVFNYFDQFCPGGKFSKHLLPNHSHFLGRAHTTLDAFTIKNTRNYEQKVAFREYAKPFTAHIRGQLYALTPEAIMNIDRIMGNNWRFTRQETFIYAKDQVSPFKVGVRSALKVQMYFGVPSYWENFHLNKSTMMKDIETTKWVWS